MIPPAPLIRNTGTGIFATISPPFILMVRAYARAGAGQPRVTYILVLTITGGESPWGFRYK